MCTCTKKQAEREETTSPARLQIISDPDDSDDCPLKKNKGPQEDKKEEEDEDWVAEAKREAAELRKKAQSYDRDTIGRVASDFTDGVVQWLGKRADYLMKKNEQELPEFVVLSTGSFARGEMAPHSDMDMVFIREQKDAAAFAEVKKGFTSALSQKLHDHKGGFSVDDVAGDVFTPESLVDAPKKQDTKLIFASSESARGLYQRFRKLRQTPEMAQKALKRMDLDRDEVWVLFEHTFIKKKSITYNKDPSINVKTLMKLIVFPIGHLADYFACTERSEPTLFTTEERIQHYVDGKLGQRILEDFRRLLWLRFELHFGRGREDDVVKKSDPQWKELEAFTLQRLTEDFSMLNEWIIRKRDELSQ